eukprot:190843_1
MAVILPHFTVSFLSTVIAVTISFVWWFRLRKRQEKDAQRAKTLKTKMDIIQNENQSKITEFGEKLALSLERTRVIQAEFIDENRMIKAKYEGVKDTLQQEETRSASLMKLNEALKHSVMNLYQEKDAMEDTMQGMLQSQNDKIMDLRSKTASFKESIRAFKEDMTSITTEFQQQLHQKMMAQKETQDMMMQDMMMQYEELSKQFEQIKIQNEQSHSSHGDKLQLQVSHDTLTGIQTHIQTIYVPAIWSSSFSLRWPCICSSTVSTWVCFLIV